MKRDEGKTELVEWICPACKSNTNSQGIPFSEARTVALHIAGKILTYDYQYQHRNWAINKLGDIIEDAKDNYTINTLAKELEPFVLEEYEERRRHEEEKIKRLIEERNATKEPRLLAYKYIETLENSLHKFVRQVLVEAYGESEDEWWAKGVPERIRIECQEKREKDRSREKPEEPYNYTNLIDLKVIIEKNWGIFELRFKILKDQAMSKRNFLENVTKSNNIRNRVMHTVREITNEDLAFLQWFSNITQVFIQINSGS